MPYLIQNATVITMDPVSGSDPVRRDIRIVDDVIESIAPTLEPVAGDTVINGTDKLVIPGLVNAHTHSWEALYKGRYDNLPLELWMALCYPILGNSRVEPDLIALRSKLFAIESLKSGVTTLVDDVLENPDQDFEQLTAVFDAYDEVGVRANISGHIISKPFTDTLPFMDEYLPPAVAAQVRTLTVPTAAEYLALSRRAFETLDGRGDGRLRYMVAPSAPQRCGEDVLVGATALAKEFDAEFHIHVLETKTQLVTGTEKYGQSLVRYLSGIGALVRNTTFAHGIWLTPEDIEMVADAGASVSHNPISNMKLGSGIAPWRELLNAGVNLGLGTDGCSSSDSPRLLDVIKATALLHKVTEPDFTAWPTVGEVLHAATLGGARSAVREATIGSLEAGKQADLVIFDLETLAFTPRQKLDVQLVYSENGSSIETVMVAGRIVVDHGTITTIDEAAVRAELGERLVELRAWQDRLDAANSVFAAPFTQMNQRAMNTPSQIHRFSGHTHA